MKQSLRSLLILIALLLYVSPAYLQQTLFINEFLASNNTTVADEFGDFDDWVEIYNASNEPINISGMYITDDLTDPTAWQIPDTSADLTTISPKGFLIIWCDKESEEGVLHAEIKLKSSGEQIGLFASDGVTAIDTLSFGEQTTDVSYGRLPDGSDTWQYFTSPTPGKSNATSDVADQRNVVNATSFRLHQNYPNPFNPETMIAYELPYSSPLTLTIFNLQGKEIRTLVNANVSAGVHNVKWDGRDNSRQMVASGVYLYRISADDFQQTRKMLLMK